MKTVLFALNSSYVHTNLAVRCLKRSLNAMQLESVIVEKSLKDRRLSVLSELYSHKAEIYCFSAYIWNISDMLYFARQLRILLPETVIVFGGPEVSFETEDFFSLHPYIDFIINGEGEQSLPELIKGIEASPSDFEKHRIIHSEAYKDFVCQGAMYDPGETFNMNILYYESSRGCPFNCAYCLSSSTKGVRGKPASAVLDDMRSFERMQGVRIIKFIDRTFNYDKRRAIEILTGLLSDEYTKKYHFEICADLLDDETMNLLGQFPEGKIQLEIGIQSTNPDTLKAINRINNTEKCLSALSVLHEKGNISLHADLIAGLPFEDYRSFANSFNDLYGKCDMLQLGFLKLLKGSSLRDNAEKYGILYSSDPPYEVFKTSWLSFDDIVRLHKIDETLERFGNSGHFRYTLLSVFESGIKPFEFFEALSDKISESFGNLSYSQINAYSLITEHALSLNNLTEDQKRKAAASARLDFLINENGSVPAFLRGDFELPVAPIIKSALTRKAGCNPAFTEVHRFFFDPEHYYVIDRKNHMCVKAVFDNT